MASVGLARAPELSAADYVRILRRHRWPTLLSTVAGALVASVYVQTLPVSYRSDAAIELDWGIPKAHLMENVDAVTRVVATYLESPDFLRKVVVALDRAESETDAAVIGAVEDLTRRLVVEPDLRFQIVRLSLSAPEKEGLVDEMRTICRLAIETYGESLKTRESGKIQYLSRRIDEERERINAVNRKIEEVSAFEKAFADYQGMRQREIELELEIGRAYQASIAARERAGLAGPRWGEEEPWIHPPLPLLENRVREGENQLLEYFFRGFTSKHPAVTLSEERTESVRRLLILELQRELSHVASQRAAFETSLRAHRGIPFDPAQRRAHVQDLETERSTLTNVYNELNAERERLRVEMRGEVPTLHLIEPPGPLPEPVRRAGRIYVSAGTTIGLLIGVSLAFLLESLRSSITRIEEIEATLGLPVIGVIRYVSIIARAPRRRELAGEEKRKYKDLYEYMAEKGDLPGGEARPPAQVLPVSDAVVMVSHARGAEADGYRYLRTHLEFAGFGRGKKTLLITSTGPQEGKSTTTANLACAFAQSGRRTLILDCNLRRSTLGILFNVPRKPGLSDVLKEGGDWRAHVREIGAVPGLSLLPAGTRPPYPTELLGFPLMRTIIAEAAAAYDMVLLDCPPTLPVPDAAILTAHCDGTALVVFHGKVPGESLMRAKEHLERTKGNLVGIILNNVMPESELGTHYYYYGYGYGH